MLSNKKNFRKKYFLRDKTIFAKVVRRNLKYLFLYTLPKHLKTNLYNYE
jgi:hypothetical protein